MIRLRQSSKKPVRRAPILLLAILTGMSGMTCDLPPSFGPEYDDKTTNYIRNFPLAAPSVTTNASLETALDQPAVWDWAWRGKTNNQFEYMSLVQEGTVGSDVVSDGYTLKADETIWRMNLVNLVGDPYFESGSIPAGWTKSVPTSVLTKIELKNFTTSHGDFLAIQTFSDYWAGFDPNTPGFILDDPATQTTAEYRMAMYSTSSVLRYIFNDFRIYTSVNSFTDTKSISQKNSELVLDTFTSTSEYHRAMFAVSALTQLIEIDDIRITRPDLSPNLRLRLMLRPTDGDPLEVPDREPDLAPGDYEFSIWIKAPADTLFYDDPARVLQEQALFSSKSVAISIKESPLNITPKESTNAKQVTEEWTRLYVRLDRDDIRIFDEKTKEVVLELSIYPFSINTDPGSVLIAAPRLWYYKD